MKNVILCVQPKCLHLLANIPCIQSLGTELPLTPFFADCEQSQYPGEDSEMFLQVVNAVLLVHSCKDPLDYPRNREDLKTRLDQIKHRYPGAGKRIILKSDRIETDITSFQNKEYIYTNQVAKLSYFCGIYSTGTVNADRVQCICDFICIFQKYFQYNIYIQTKSPNCKCGARSIYIIIKC